MRQDGNYPGTNIKVHNVHILDASGSMAGPKYTNALGGINEELNVLKTDTSGIEFTETVIEFDSGYNSQLRITTHYYLTPIAACGNIKGVGANGGTPLNQTVGETIEKLLKDVQPGDKVIMKIFTDGEENQSQGKYKPEWGGACPALRTLIEAVQANNNFTIAFIGTKVDTENVIRNLSVERSNTIVHANTAASIGHTYLMSRGATQSYAKRVAQGASAEELRTDFFKRIEEDDQQAPIGLAATDPKKKKETKTKQ